MSGICAFFGHRDTPYSENLENKLEETAGNLIHCGFNEFWCCEQGTFDWMSRMVMVRLKKKYPHIFLNYICPYNPDNYSQIRRESLLEYYEIIYPHQLTNVPPQFAIPKRNRYIAENADVIICYITHEHGGAYKAVEIAKHRGISIINLAER